MDARPSKCVHPMCHCQLFWNAQGDHAVGQRCLSREGDGEVPEPVIFDCRIPLADQTTERHVYQFLAVIAKAEAKNHAPATRSYRVTAKKGNSGAECQPYQKIPSKSQTSKNLGELLSLFPIGPFSTHLGDPPYAQCQG